MEALGVFPEQTRTDRDEFVEIKYDSIDYKRYPEVSTYMDINWPHNTSNYDTKYEYGSVVQYISKAFSKNKELTILAKGKHAVRHQQMMGQKYNVAFQDYKLINRHFCNKKCEKQLGCWRGGYEDPNNCWKCICPFPFENNICDGLLKNDDGCSFRYERASDIKRFLSFAGWKSCYGYIVAPSSDYRIELNITHLHMTKYEVCTRDNSMVEIKYLADKSLMGLCFCGDINKPYKIVSEDTLMVIAYSGYYYVDSIEMEYKAIPARASINIEKN